MFSTIDIEKGLLDKWGAVLPFYRNIKEEGVIAFFNKEYLKTDKLERSLSEIIKGSSYLREKADYVDKINES